MAVTHLGTGTDETQDFKLWSATSGTVTSDATAGVPRLGPRVIKCDSTGSNVAAYVQQVAILADAGRRVSFWYRFSAAPATTPHIWGGYTTGGTGIIFIGLNASRVLSLETASTNFPATTALSANTWYRITLSYTITSTSVNTFKLYIGDSTTPELTKTNITLGSVGTADARFGMVQAFGASKQVWVDDTYADDSTALTNPGDFAVTAKHYVGTSEGAGFTDWDTFITTTRANGSRYLNVSENPASDTNGWDQAATTQKYEKYLLQAAGAGDLNIAAGTVIGWQAWVRAKTSASSAVASITDNDVDTAISTTTTIAQFIHLTTSATYPTGRFGMRSTGTTADTFMYEGGVLVAYVPGLPPVLLTGTVAAHSTATDTVAVTRAPTGTSVTHSTAADTIAVTRPLTGTSAPHSTSSDTVAVTRKPAGTATGHSTAGDTVAVTRQPTGTAAGRSTSSDVIAVTRKPSGTSLAHSAASAIIALIRALTGTAAALSTARGLLTLVAVLSGVAAAHSGASGALTVTRVLSATSAAYSTASSTVTVGRSLSGAAAAHSTDSDIIAVTRPLSGAAAGQSAGTGHLGVGGVVTLSGTGAPHSSSSGALTLTRSLSGTAGAQAGGSGALSLTRLLAGTGVGHASSSGALLVTRPLNGASTGHSSASGLVLQTQPLSGPVAGHSGGAGMLTVLGFADLHGAGAAHSSSSGALAVTRSLAGPSSGQSTAAGSLLLTYRLAGALQLSGTVAARSGGRGRVHPTRGHALATFAPGAAALGAILAPGAAGGWVVLATAETTLQEPGKAATMTPTGGAAGTFTASGGVATFTPGGAAGTFTAPGTVAAWTVQAAATPDLTPPGATGTLTPTGAEGSLDD